MSWINWECDNICLRYLEFVRIIKANMGTGQHWRYLRFKCSDHIIPGFCKNARRSSVPWCNGSFGKKIQENKISYRKNKVQPMERQSQCLHPFYHLHQWFRGYDKVSNKCSLNTKTYKFQAVNQVNLGFRWPTSPKNYNSRHQNPNSKKHTLSSTILNTVPGNRAFHRESLTTSK